MAIDNLKGGQSEKSPVKLQASIAAKAAELRGGALRGKKGMEGGLSASTRILGVNKKASQNLVKYRTRELGDNKNEIGFSWRVKRGGHRPLKKKSRCFFSR